MYVGGKGGGDCVQNPRQMLRQLNLFFEYGIHPFMYTNWIYLVLPFRAELRGTLYIEYRSQEMSSV